jgi:hypothetical protein
VKRLALIGTLFAALAAGCGGSSKDTQPKGFVHPLGAYVAPGCSSGRRSAPPSTWR